MTDESAQKFWDMMEGFETCMVVTRDGNRLRARPMAPRVSQNRREILFLTERATHKVEEIERDAEVACAFSRHGEYVSVSGRARISGDRALVASIWDSEAEAWLPQGKEDPSVVVLAVEPSGAEIWDAKANQVKHAWDFAKAYLGDGDRPDTGEHRKLNL